MTQQALCPCPSEKGISRVESLPFSSIPLQSRLFLDYQEGRERLKRYYPEMAVCHTQLSSRIQRVLENHKADRGVLCDVLEEMNRECDAGSKTLDNIALLREPDTVAVVSGQQAGLFGGPLYTVFKALSAVKLSECLRGRGFKAVPVFWIATEDHDFAEVSKAYINGADGSLKEIVNEPKRCYENLPVGYVKNDASIKGAIEELFEALPEGDFGGDLRDIIEASWKPGMGYGEAFARMLAAILGKYGLILLCPLDERLKKLAAPIYSGAIRKSGEIVSALRARSEELIRDGYHAQVLINEDYFPLFYQAEDNTRNALKKTETGTFRARDAGKEFSLEELAEIAESEPHRLSPSVVLRSVVQDYLLPTICYFGGAAEIAYFAQSAEVYRILERPLTPIFHRQSFTLIEPKHAKTLSKYSLELAGLFIGEEELMRELVEKYLNADVAGVFAEVEEKINTELNRLDRNLSPIEPTLGENLAKRRKKIIYHIANLRKKFHAAQIRKDETVKRRVDNVFSALLPHRHLQERTLGIAGFYNLYGSFLLDWIYQSIDLDDKGHRILYL